jgi:hypothetical protein
MSASSSASTFTDEELLCLLRDDSVGPDAIVAEMEDAGAPPLPAPALVAARAILKDLGPAQVPAIEALPPTLRTVVLNVALGLQSVELLTLLTSSSDKAVGKDAKRCLHVLKSRGLKVEAPKAAPVVAAAPEEQPVYMSTVDGLGRRVVLFTGAARGGVDVAQLVLSDESGVVSAELAPLGRKAYREFLERLFALKQMMVVETPRAYARSLVARALDLNAVARRPVPASFNDVAFLLGPAVGPMPSPGRTLPHPENEPALVLKARELFDLPELATWIPPDKDADAFDRKAREITSSALYIDEAQKSAALQQLVAASVEAFWTKLQRDRYAERLFDVAWLFTRAKREDHANLAVASASALAGETPIGAIPFAYLIFEALIPLATPSADAPRHVPAPATPGSLIIPA